MARVTVEDCVQKVDNYFSLVLLAAQRARLIASGAEIKVSRDNDKNHVIALREIANEKISIAALEDNLVKSYQTTNDEELEETKIEKNSDILESAEYKELAEEIKKELKIISEDSEINESFIIEDDKSSMTFEDVKIQD